MKALTEIDGAVDFDEISLPRGRAELYPFMYPEEWIRPLRAAGLPITILDFSGGIRRALLTAAQRAGASRVVTGESQEGSTIFVQWG